MKAAAGAGIYLIRADGRSRHRPTAVVVDDSPAFRRAATRLLYAAGFRVVGEARDDREALEQVRRRRPALVLLDVLLPDRTGARHRR